jgi:hypothetical protein
VDLARGGRRHNRCRRRRVAISASPPPIRVSVFPAVPAGWQLTASTPTTSETLSPDASGFFYVRKRDDETAALRLVRGTESVPFAIIPSHYTAHDFVVHVQQR